MEPNTLSAVIELGPWASVLSYAVALLATLAIGAVSLSNVRQGSNFYVADIISSAAGDTTITVAHGLGAISNNAAADFRGLGPQSVTITPRLSQGWLSRWRVTTVNTTNVILNKTASTSSANAGIQATLVVSLPASVIR